MSNKVSNFSDLIQRVTASCLLHPLSAGRQDLAGNRRGEYDSEEEDEAEEGEIQYEDTLEKENGKDEVIRVKSKSGVSVKTVEDMEMVMEEVFTAASALKRAYVALQEAHSPWDPEKMHDADMAMVAELRRIGSLRERFRRMRSGGRRKNDSGRGMLREVVAPYEAVVKELKKEVKLKDIEIENLKEKVKVATDMANGNGGKKHRLLSSRKVNCNTQGHSLTLLFFDLNPYCNICDWNMNSCCVSRTGVVRDDDDSSERSIKVFHRDSTVSNASCALGYCSCCSFH